MTKTTHGGPGRGQGRHKEPGYDKSVKMRFLTGEEEEAIIKEFTPRQRVEILLAALARKPNKVFAADP